MRNRLWCGLSLGAWVLVGHVGTASAETIVLGAAATARAIPGFAATGGFGTLNVADGELTLTDFVETVGSWMRADTAAESLAPLPNRLDFRGSVHTQTLLRESIPYPTSYADSRHDLAFQLTTPDVLRVTINKVSGGSGPNGTDVGSPTFDIDLRNEAGVGGGFSVASYVPEQTTYEFNLAEGVYTLSGRMTSYLNLYTTADQFGEYDVSYSFGNGFTLGDGTTQDNPVVPIVYAILANLRFVQARSGQWFDPVPAEGFEFEMTGDSLFTNIIDLPTGFADPFGVSVDGVSVGTFNPGDSVDFSAFAGGGVRKFTVSGINPAVDGEDPKAFPIQLGFNTATADFTMRPLTAACPAQAVPLPTAAWGGMALLGGLGAARRARRRRDGALVG